MPISGEQPAESLPVLILKEAGKTAGGWTLTLHPTHLALAEMPDPQPYIILREDVMKSATLIEGLRAFMIQKPRKLTFNLTAQGVTMLANWIGKTALGKFYLKRRYSWLLPLAILWIFGALPWAGDPASGLPPAPFDPFAMFLGCTLAISWAAAKWLPHPILFLIDAIWVFLMIIDLSLQIADGRSKGWIVLIVMLSFSVVSGFKNFSRFRGTNLSGDLR